MKRETIIENGITYHVTSTPRVTRYFKYGTDLCHREGDLPAYETISGIKSWWYLGKLHRLVGPAFQGLDGYVQWHYHGKRVFVTSQEEYEQWLKFRAFE